MIKNILLLLSLMLGQVTFAQNKDIVAIKALLATQEQAWNKGNLELFMIGYWESDSLVFIGKDGPKYGYKNTLDNYKKGYPDASHMGKLHFDLLSIQPLGMEHYFVIGKWQLKRTIGDVSGHFTLVFKKTKKGWKVIADHSS